MSKEEQFEHIENKIRQAAENNQPAFDEKAWGKMQALLDKDERKPRPFFWLWFLLPLLLVGTGSAYLFYNYKINHKNSAGNIAKTATGKNSPHTLQQPEAGKEQTVTENSSQSTIQKKGEESLAKTGLMKERQTTGNILPQKNDEQIKEVTFQKQSKVIKSKTKTAQARTKIDVSNGEIDQRNNSNIDRQKINIPDKGKTKIKASGNEPVYDAVIEEKETGDKNLPADIKKSDTDRASVIAKNEKKPDVNTRQDKKDQPLQKKKKSSHFYLLGSLGPDIGSVKLFSFNNSSVAAKYGVGVGYQLNKKWSIQTGFYAANKKYTAGPNDYHPKEHSYWSYVTITKVYAECMIYEIPLMLRYNFLQQSSVSYYATIGLSSYLMKEEDYNYHYIAYNVPAEKYYSYTGNKHLFSTLSLSGGIEKKISNVLSLQFEPSVSLPLSGVGDGKVKLFSTAIMLGIKYLPFKK
jgi:Outer membrane protein beta-barrel domain